MSFSRTFDIPKSQQEKCPNPKSIVSYGQGKWHTYSTATMLIQIKRYRNMLHNLGIKNGEMIVMVPGAVIAEWVFLDLAAQENGITVVAVHDTILQAKFAHIKQMIPAKFWFFLDPSNANQCLPPPAERDDLQVIYLHAPDHIEEQVPKLLPSEPTPLPDLDIDPMSLATIIFTSGTTGVPKGVMLSHHNIVSNIQAVVPLLPIENHHRAMSFLPYSHIFERAVILGYLAMGNTVFMPGPKHDPKKAFQYAKPHIFSSVPRILEKMNDEIIRVRNTQPLFMQKLLDWALRFGGSFEPKMAYNPIKWIQILFIRHVVFRKLRLQLGGHLKYILVGAAYLQPRLIRLMTAAGIKVGEGYGLTETSPAITINRYEPGLNRIGTVGLPINGVEVRIAGADDQGAGEIQVKGPNVMMGYYQNPDATKKVFTDDGWFRTGDVGKFVEGKFLQITDREKDIFKTSAGKYVAPIALENHFLHSDYIAQILIVGFQRPYVAALIVPNFTLLESWCHSNGVHWTSPVYMVHNIKVKALIQSEIDLFNTDLPRYQQVRAFHLCHQEWQESSGYLTHTLKLKRSTLHSDFNKEIEAMYQ